MVKVQPNRLGSSRQRDDCQCSIDLAVVAKSAGLVEEQVVREQYLFWRFSWCEIAVSVVWLDRMATEEPFLLREIPPEEFALSPKSG